MFAEQQDALLPKRLRSLNELPQQIFRDSAFSKIRLDRKGENDHVAAVRIMSHQVFERLVADIVFVGGPAVDKTHHLTEPLRHQKALRIFHDSLLNALPRGAFSTVAGCFDGMARCQIFMFYLPNSYVGHIDQSSVYLGILEDKAWKMLEV